MQTISISLTIVSIFLQISTLKSLFPKTNVMLIILDEMGHNTKLIILKMRKIEIIRTCSSFKHDIKYVVGQIFSSLKIQHLITSNNLAYIKIHETEKMWN